MTKRKLTALAAAVFTVALAQAYAQMPPVPAPGQSPRIDQIKKRGVLLVGALGESPWLRENPGNDAQPFTGPAWELANEYAKLMGVKLKVVPVSHETKIPIIASGQVDMTIAPLAETPERDKVVDFVIYSNSALCFFGEKSDPKLKGITTVDQLNSPNITIAYFTGTPPESWLPKRLADAKLRGVPGSGANAPVDEILSHRADVAPIDKSAFPELEKKLPQLESIPPGDRCLASDEMATPVGLAIDKNQPVYEHWLQAVAKQMEPELQATEIKVMKGEE
jgi:polar amino acid transport system substrate-binding protein